MKREDIVASLKRFKTTKGKEYQIRRIGLFGSAARDRINPQSDIDVVVKLDRQDCLPLSVLNRIWKNNCSGRWMW